MSDPNQKLWIVLRSHFPDASEEEAERATKKILSAKLGARTIENLRASSRRPEKDQQSIQDAVKGLRRAEKSLSKLGFHGGEAITEIVRSLRNDDVSPSFRAIIPYSNSGQELAEHIRMLANALSNAEKVIDLEGEHFFSNFGEDYLKGAPAKEVNEQVYQTCVSIFERLSGKKAVRRVDSINSPNQNSGPFIDFAREVFDSLGLKASSADYQMDRSRAQNRSS